VGVLLRNAAHLLALVMAAAVIFVALQIGILGMALSLLLSAAAVVIVVLTVVRLGRRRAQLSWLTHPAQPGFRRFGLQFLIRAALWLLVGYFAVLAFPRSFVSASYAALCYTLIWAAVVLLVLSGLAPGRKVSWLNLGATGLTAVFLVVQLIQVNLPASGAVAVSSPVRGTWVVGSGGPSALINHHYPLVQQRNALDLVIPFARKISRPPIDLRAYPAYGKPVSAPADGTVVRVIGDRPDQAIGTTDAAHPAGNHVVIQLDSGRFLLLAHLRPESIVVAPGAKIRRGDRLAEVGNSGNTSEPHLHIQLQSGPDLFTGDGAPTPGLVTYPITFDDSSRSRSGEINRPAADLRTGDLAVTG
jgi:hypothetical protein